MQKELSRKTDLKCTSKRRAGLFKKASQLCILSGAEIAIVVKSPGKRTFAFGQPSVDAVIDRYLTRTSATAEQNNRPSVLDFNGKYAQVSKELEAEKRRRAVIEETKKAANDGGFWWDEAVDDLGLEELEQYVAALEELKKIVSMKADELMIMKANSSMMFGMNESSNHGGLGLMSDCATSTVPHGFDCANSSMMFGMNESSNHGGLSLMSDCATSTVPHGFDCANSSMMFGMNESANHGGLGFMSDCATSMIPHGFDFGRGQF